MAIIINENTKFVGTVGLDTVGSNPGNFLVLDNLKQISSRTAAEVLLDLNIPTKLIELEDVPNSYANKAGHVLVVKDTEDGTEFVPRTYVHDQGTPALVWNITHNLKKKYPSVTTISSVGSRVHGRVDYIDENSLSVTFNAAFSGEASLN